LRYSRPFEEVANWRIDMRTLCCGVGMTDAASDLVTAHSEAELSERDGDDDGGLSDDIEVQIQRMMAGTLDDDLRVMPTAVVLDAIEAQIQAVIHNLGQGGSHTEVDEAILARFRAKNLSVEAATGCSAADLPPNPTAKRGALPYYSHEATSDFVMAVLCYFIGPCLVLAFVLFLYTRTDWVLCGYNCICSFSESARVNGVFYTIQQLPRCLVFAFLADELATSVRDAKIAEEDEPSCTPNMARVRVWVFALLSLVCATGSEILVAGLNAPLYLSVPVRALSFALPTACYCALKRAVTTAAPVIWLQLIPIFYQIIVPLQYTDPPVAVIAVWPLIMVTIDRLFLYCLLAMTPTSSTGVARTVMIHIAPFYSQAQTAVMILALSFDSAALLVIYSLQVTVLEFLASTHWIDQVILRAANALSAGVSGGQGRVFAFGHHDLRLMSSYARHFSYGFALCAMVPLIAIQRWPVVLHVTTCDGYPQAATRWWALWGVGAGAFLTATCLTVIHRLATGAALRPLLIPCPFWAVATALYMALLTPTAFGYVSP
jgi:hypothetical protein